MRSNRPILVTGSYRSGTTWVGDMLSVSPQVHYIHEPFAPMYPRSWMMKTPSIRLLHEYRGSESPYADDVRRITTLRPPWLDIASRARGVKNWIRLTEDYLRTGFARWRGARPLIKDPFLLLSVDWFFERSKCDVVILVRHPAAFVSSVKRLSWRFDVRWLLDQPVLIDGLIKPFREELEIQANQSSSLIDNACLMWRVLNSVVVIYKERNPDWIVKRHEDIAIAPVSGFRQLYSELDVSWTPSIEKKILRFNSSAYAEEVNPIKKGGTRRDSLQAISTWRERLNEEEISRVRRLTEDVSCHWYSGDDW